MERPGEFAQLIQAYVVIAIGVLAVIVLFDSKTRRSQEHRLALILGTSGKFQVDPQYLQSQVRILGQDAAQSVAQSRQMVKKVASSEGYEGPYKRHGSSFGIINDLQCGDSRQFCNSPTGSGDYYEGF